MRRLVLLIAAALLFAVLPSSFASAGAPAGTDVNVLHGLGEPPGDFPVDIYLGETDATEWDLVLADAGYDDFENLGAVAPGGYNVLICEAVPAPLATITGCADNDSPAVNGNPGTNVDIPAVASVTLVAAYNGGSTGASGRPTVTVFENDLTCVTAGNGRLTVANAGVAGTGDVVVDGTVEGTIAYGETLRSDLAAGNYAVQLDADSDIDSGGTPVQSLVLTTEYAVGNPQFGANFEFLTTSLDLQACGQPTTTTTVGPTTTTVRPAPAAIATVAQPRFTG